MIRRSRGKRQVFWLGNASAGPASYLTAGTLNTVAANESPVSFRLELFTQGGYGQDAVFDELNMGARIERCLGQLSIRAGGGENANTHLWRITAGICMQEYAISSASGLVPVTGGTDNLGEYVDMHSVSVAGANYFVLQRRWLWLRRWLLSDDNGIYATAYPSSTDGYLSPGSRCMWDIKPKAKLQYEGRSRSIFSPTLYVWASTIGGAAGTSIVVIEDVFWRTLWSRAARQ